MGIGTSAQEESAGYFRLKGVGLCCSGPAPDESPQRSLGFRV